MNEAIGKICPYCKTEIKEEDSVKFCPSCGIPHHEGCWEENKGCTTFGCKEQHYEPQGTNPTSVCDACGAALGDGQNFCPKCGVSKNTVKTKVCAGCGTVLQDIQQFCPKCGQKYDAVSEPAVNTAISQFNANIEQQKKKTKTRPALIAVVLVVVAIIGIIIGSIISENKRLEAIEEYKETAAAFSSTVLSSGSEMEDIGNAIKSAWRSYVYSSYGTYYNGTYIYSVDSAVAAAQKEQASKISSVESRDSQIRSMYNTLCDLPDDDDPELQRIRNAVEDVYDAYTEMYDVVIDVSGNYNTYTSAFSRVDTNLASALQALDNLV